jgi:PhoH-like ATPase
LVDGDEASSAPCELRLGDSLGQWVGKTLVFDTNVVINDPNALERFPGALIVIPGVLFDELEKHKSDPKIGRAARQFSRTIDGLRRKGKLNQGVQLENGATVRTDFTDHSWLLIDTNIDPAVNDNKILATALFYHYEADADDSVFLISDETNLRIKADSVGLLAESLEYDLRKKQIEPLPETHFKNYVALKVEDSNLRAFKESGFVPKPEGLNVAPNQFVLFSSDEEEGSMATLGRYFYDREEPSRSGIKKIADFSHLPIQPKNMEQAMLLDVLMDPNIHLVISQSPAGTGKTFLALVAGLLQLSSADDLYDKVMITRTLVQIGAERLGAMPGDMNTKLGHWNISVDDAFDALAKADKVRRETAENDAQASVDRISGSSRRSNRTKDRFAREQAAKGEKKKNFTPNKSKVSLVAFPHLRGRSITDSFLILDEAQNTSVHEIKTFLTRAGEGSKMVILGDATQIDSPFLNERNNGLTVTTNLILNDESLAGRSLVAHVELTEGVRSLLAEYARLLFEKL